MFSVRDCLFTMFGDVCKIAQRILLDCDKSNVLLARIIFFCVLLKAFSFLSACIRDPTSNKYPFNIILIVTGVEIVIENCFPEVHKYCLILEIELKKIPIMVDDAICHLSCYTSTHAFYLAPLRRYGTSKII